MGEIFRKAARVIAWLGPGGEDSDAAGRWLDGIGDLETWLPLQFRNAASVALIFDNNSSNVFSFLLGGGRLDIARWPSFCDCACDFLGKIFFTALEHANDSCCG